MVIIMLFLMISTAYAQSTVSLVQLKSPLTALNQLSGPDKKELYLLRVEHYLELEATGDTDSFSVQYVFPPEYGYQVPIVLELFDDSTATIYSYGIEKDTYEPNRVVNFTLGPMEQGEHSLIHFTIWVLVEDFDFSDIPQQINMPESKQNTPDDTHPWLSSSDMVQSKRIRIRTTANKLEGKDDTVFNYANNVSHFILKHRYGLFLLQLWTRTFFKQDALTTLKINGENVGRSHLACALFRTKNIPARVILANNDQGFWTQMHYMVEYYHPTYGWVLLDSTKGEVPYPTHKQIINRICSIDDEDDTKHDYIYRFMKGEERWIWLDTDQVEPYYVNCDEGSKSQMFTEAILELSTFASDYTFFRTQNVFAQYEKFLGSDLSTADENHVEQAVAFQTKACYSLIETQDIDEYIFYIEKAYDEYKAIEE
jgi:hypothetical protein